MHLTDLVVLQTASKPRKERSATSHEGSEVNKVLIHMNLIAPEIQYTPQVVSDNHEHYVDHPNQPSCILFSELADLRKPGGIPVRTDPIALHGPS